MNSIKTQVGSYYWGPAYDGSMVEYIDGTMQPYKAYKNNYKDAYDTGFNTTTNVAINGGNDKTSFYTSIGYKHASSTTPGNTFDRLNMMTKASHKISNKVEVEAGINFANSLGGWS